MARSRVTCLSFARMSRTTSTVRQGDQPTLHQGPLLTVSKSCSLVTCNPAVCDKVVKLQTGNRNLVRPTAGVVRAVRISMIVARQLCRALMSRVQKMWYVLERWATSNGDGQPATGNQRRATSDGQPATGSAKSKEWQAKSDRQQATANERQTKSDRQRATGNGKQRSDNNDATTMSDDHRATSYKQQTTTITDKNGTWVCNVVCVQERRPMSSEW